MPQAVVVSRAWFVATAAALALASPSAVAAGCTVTAAGVDFGSYDPLSPADDDSAGNLRLECDAAVAATVSLGPGEGALSAREMRNGASVLRYNLYTDPSRTIIWGDGNGGSDTVSVRGTRADLPIYGRAPARQNIRPGRYDDTIIVTMSY